MANNPLDLVHMSIDLETLATSRDALVLCIGWSVHHYREGLLESGVIYLSPEDQPGRRIDPRTVQWWLGQSDEARASVKAVGYEHRVEEAMRILGNTWRGHSCSMAWGFGASFDLGILEDLARGRKEPTPWGHKNQGCIRTLAQVFPEVSRPLPRVAHSAEQDAVAQGEYLMKLMGRAIYDT